MIQLESKTGQPVFILPEEVGSVHPSGLEGLSVVTRRGPEFFQWVVKGSSAQVRGQFSRMARVSDFDSIDSIAYQTDDELNIQISRPGARLVSLRFPKSTSHAIAHQTAFEAFAKAESLPGEWIGARNAEGYAWVKIPD